MPSTDENLEMYSEYNKTLRAWFVGFGFGAPALFIVNDKARDILINSCDHKLIIRLFVIGAAAQILMSFINKVIAWSAYHCHSAPQGQSRHCVVQWIAKLENAFFIDVIFDLISMVAFGYSIVLIVGLF